MTRAPDFNKETRPADGHDAHPLRCADIQARMLDYMQGELGDGQTDLVREHTRRCAICRGHMQELNQTVGLLHNAPFARGTLPQHLSVRCHDRLVRALMHPVREWIYVHHILVSILVALVALTLAVVGLRYYRVWRDSIDPGIPVVIGEEAPPAADADPTENRPRE